MKDHDKKRIVISLILGYETFIWLGDVVKVSSK